jgi:hypothetical protein
MPAAEGALATPRRLGSGLGVPPRVRDQPRLADRSREWS